MKPVEFNNFDGDSNPATPIGDIHTAMNKDIEILSSDSSFDVLSYYFNDGVMVLEIEKANN